MELQGPVTSVTRVAIGPKIAQINSSAMAVKAQWGGSTDMEVGPVFLKDFLMLVVMAVQGLVAEVWEGVRALVVVSSVALKVIGRKIAQIPGQAILEDSKVQGKAIMEDNHKVLFLEDQQEVGGAVTSVEVKVTGQANAGNQASIR